MTTETTGAQTRVFTREIEGVTFEIGAGRLAQNAAECDVAFSLGSTACSTGLCGNGQIDPGESCDDGNTARDSGSGEDTETIHFTIR